MKTKIFVPFGIFRLLAMLIALAFAFVSIYMLIISFNPGQSVGLGIAFVSMGIAVMIVCCFVRPIAIFKGNKLILYGNGGDLLRKMEILCSDVKECKICRMRDAKEGIGIPGRGNSFRMVTLFAKMKKPSPFHVSIDGFAIWQRKKIVAEIEKRRDYYAPIIEKERQEKIKAKLQEQKDREKQ